MAIAVKCISYHSHLVVCLSLLLGLPGTITITRWWGDIAAVSHLRWWGGWRVIQSIRRGIIMQVLTQIQQHSFGWWFQFLLIQSVSILFDYNLHAQMNMVMNSASQRILDDTSP
jgi:hypothetical protein